MIMFELYRFAGIAIVLLGFMYILICGMLLFFKHSTLLNKITPEIEDEAFKDTFIIFFVVFGIGVLILDIGIPTACASALFSSIILSAVIMCKIIDILIKIRNKLPQR